MNEKKVRVFDDKKDVSDDKNNMLKQERFIYNIFVRFGHDAKTMLPTNPIINLDNLTLGIQITIQFTSANYLDLIRLLGWENKEEISNEMHINIFNELAYNGSQKTIQLPNGEQVDYNAQISLQKMKYGQGYDVAYFQDKGSVRTLREYYTEIHDRYNNIVNKQISTQKDCTI